MNKSVIFHHVSKKYKMYKSNADKLKDIVMPGGYGEDFFALQDISFTANEGDVIGVIGVNGAGKSTLSNLITGIIPPTKGTIETNGETALIAINSGLNNELSGMENIELKLLMLGFSKKQIKQLKPEIIEFADIGNFINQPVKKYSSGMKSRLGFAISVNVNPDILVIDEALSVGDQTFADKCFDKMNEFKEAGKTIFFISHSMNQVKKFCTKALWLEAGQVKNYGDIEDVLPEYQKFLKEFKSWPKEKQKNFKKMIMEKRSKEQAAQSEEAAAAMEADEADFVPRKALKRSHKKPGGSGKKAVIGIIAILAVLAAVFASVNLMPDHKEKTNAIQSAGTGNQAEKTKHEEAASAQQKDKSYPVYVTYSTVNVRSDADINSEQVKVASFGEELHVYGQKDNENDQVTWLKVKLNNGKSGWVSKNAVAKVNQGIKDEDILNALNLSTASSINDLLGAIGKDKSEIDSLGFDQNIYVYHYNEDDTADNLSFNLDPNSVDQIKIQLGTPQLEDNESRTFLYHGEGYNYTFVLQQSGNYKLQISSI